VIGSFETRMTNKYIPFFRGRHPVVFEVK